MVLLWSQEIVRFLGDSQLVIPFLRLELQCRLCIGAHNAIPFQSKCCQTSQGPRIALTETCSDG